MKKIISLYIFVLCCAIQINAQCFEDRHSTNWYDAWVSCETRENPNPANDDSHWIMYDFGQPYRLLDSKIWNINDPSNLDYGFRRVKIDYSIDGVEWTTFEEVTFDQGMGVSTYEGFEGPNMEGIDAQFLLLTALDNYGGECYGFGEIKINVEQSTVSNENLQRENLCLKVNAYPNPFTTSSIIEVSAQCAGLVHYSIRDIFGHAVEQGIFTVGNSTEKKQFGNANLAAGHYVLELRQDDAVMYYKILKQ